MEEKRGSSRIAQVLMCLVTLCVMGVIFGRGGINCASAITFSGHTYTWYDLYDIYDPEFDCNDIYRITDFAGEFDLSYFPNLESLYCSSQNLTELDVSGCPALTYLNCHDNKLTKLDVSGCPALTYLDCNSNNLTALDVSGCPALTELNCTWNKLTELELDVSGCPVLTELYCGSNNLTALDVSGCPALTYLYCFSNKLTALDVSGNPALTELLCDSNSLTELDVSGCPALTELRCFSNKLTALDVSGCPALTELNCFSNKLTALELDVNGCLALTKLRCYSNNLTELDVSGCPALTELGCFSNKLTALDVSGCPALTHLDCYSNNLTALDVSGCPALTYLRCDLNSLTELDVRGCPALTHLNCYYNNLTELDVSGCSALTYLRCDSNSLTELDVSGCSALTELWCSSNKLTELDVSGCSALTELRCSSNKLTELDVSGCSALTELNCGYNKLTKLDVSGCSALTELSCYYNNLTKLDVSGCSALTHLDCYYNNLTELDVSGCPALTELSCDSNKLTELDVSGCSALTKLYCYYNNLTGLSVRGLSQLTYLDCSPQHLVRLIPEKISSEDKEISSRESVVARVAYDYKITIEKNLEIYNLDAYRYGYEPGTGKYGKVYCACEYDPDTGAVYYSGKAEYLEYRCYPGFTNSNGEYVYMECRIDPQYPVVPELRTEEGDSIEELQYKSGAVDYAMNTYDNDYFYLYIPLPTGEDQEDFSGILNISLPEGFSFEPEEYIREMQLTDMQNYSGYSMSIYPLCMPEYRSTVTFSVTGGIELALEVPVEKIDPIVYVRPTENVNKEYSDAIPAVVTLSSPSSELRKTSYSDELCWMGCTLSQAVYNESYVIESLRNLGYRKFETYGYEDTGNSVACCLGQRKIIDGGKVYTSLAVVIRGTFGYEWIGNFIVVDPAQKENLVHANFYKSMQDVKARIEAYCKQTGIDRSSSYMYICGHSRAGAVADLLAHEYNIASSKQKFHGLAAYTFAAPNSTKLPAEDENIFNILYYGDMVGYVPFGGNFGKYGKTFVLGFWDTDAPAGVHDAFRKYCGRDYMNPVSPNIIQLLVNLKDEPNQDISNPVIATLLGKAIYKAGVSDNGIAQAHGAENYMAWIEGNGKSGARTYNSCCKEWESRSNVLQKNAQDVYRNIKVSGKIYTTILRLNMVYGGLLDLFSEMNDYAGDIVRQQYVFSASCPVNVNIYNEEDELVMNFVDHQLVDFDFDSAIGMSAGETDLSILDRNQSYRVEIVGTGEGTMEVQVLLLSEDIECLDQTVIDEIPVRKDGVYSFYLTPDTQISSLELQGDLGDRYRQTLRLPALLTRIDAEAFAGDTGILAVQCPDGLTAIGAGAFGGCTKLEWISIPASVEEIDAGAFDGCADLTIYAPEGSYAQSFADSHSIAFVKKPG